MSWTPGDAGRGAIVVFTVDVGRTLLGLDVQAPHDRLVDARLALAPRWHGLLDDLLAAGDDAATLHAPQRHLAGPWQALAGRTTTAPTLAQLARHWVQSLGLRARGLRRTHGARQVERRIKEESGRSLRAWQALVRVDGVFFGAREQADSVDAIDWADLAQREGFADQAHLIRAVKRATGFTPTEFSRRYAEHESFWMYRLWV